MILEGWSNVRRHVICERWRESYFKLLHRGIYGFNIPLIPTYPNRITACPKCKAPLTDLWHGVWTCPATQRYCDQIVCLIYLFALEISHSQITGAPDFPLHETTWYSIRGGGDTGDTGPIHTVLLLAKRCFFKIWLEPKVPDISVLIAQLIPNTSWWTNYTRRDAKKWEKTLFFKKKKNGNPLL